jgi:hypothetical protein
MDDEGEIIYIYVLIDPRTDEIKYVGKKNNPEKRLYSHLCPCMLKADNIKNRWLKKLKKEKLKPIMKVIDTTDNDHWEEKEKYWIKHYRELGCPLKNISDGGLCGPFGENYTEEMMSERNDKIRQKQFAHIETKKERRDIFRKKLYDFGNISITFDEFYVTGKHHIICSFLLTILLLSRSKVFSTDGTESIDLKHRVDISRIFSIEFFKRQLGIALENDLVKIENNIITLNYSNPYSPILAEYEFDGGKYISEYFIFNAICPVCGCFYFKESGDKKDMCGECYDEYRKESKRAAIYGMRLRIKENKFVIDQGE